MLASSALHVFERLPYECHEECGVLAFVGKGPIGSTAAVQ